MKTKNISFLAILTILLITCMMVFAVNMVYAADTTQTAISTGGNTTTSTQPNLLVEFGGYALTLILVPLFSKLTAWLITQKFVPASVKPWLAQIDETDIANAITEARKLINMTPAERLEWARKYLQDRYKQLPSSVANKLLEDKYQEIVKSPAITG